MGDAPSWSQGSRFTISVGDDGVEVAIHGALDATRLATFERVTAAALTLVDDGARVTLDVARCTAIDGVGVRALISALRAVEAAGGVAGVRLGDGEVGVTLTQTGVVGTDGLFPPR